MQASIIIPITRPERAKECIAAIKQNAGIPSDQYEIITEVDTGLIGCPKMVAKLTQQTKSDRVLFLGDDTIPEKDFLIHAIKKMNAFPGGFGVVGLNTQDINGEHGNPIAHWMAHKKMLDYILGGEFFSPDYKHCWCDNELKDIAEENGRWDWAEDSKITHNHPINKSADLDEDYKRAYSEENKLHDQKTYWTRKRKRMADKYGVKLAIGLPLTDKQVYNEFFFSFMRVVTSYISTGGYLDILAPDYPGTIDAVRNNLVQKALNIGATHLLFMDTDQIYENPDMVERLLAHKNPVVATRVHKRYPPFSPLLLRGEIGKLLHVPDEEIKPDDFETELSIDFAGTGCVLIDTQIFIDMYPEKPFELLVGEDGKPIGEDISFFGKLKDRGIPVFADCSIEISHLTFMACNWNEYKLFKKIHRR